MTDPSQPSNASADAASCAPVPAGSGAPARGGREHGSLVVSSLAFLWGLQSSFFGPTLTLMLVALYHASAGEVGVVLMVYNAVGFLAALVIPTWADRRRSYVPLTVASAVLMVLLVVALAVSPSLWWASVSLVVFGAPGGTGITLLFAQMRHGGAGVREMMNTRAMMSLSWVAGPPIAAFIIGLWGNRALLWSVAFIGLFTVASTLVWARQARATSADTDTDPAAHDDLVELSRVAVVLVVIAWVLLQATNAATMSAMNLYVTDRLHLAVMWGGITLAVAAALEVPAMTLVGRLSQRTPMMTLVVTGCVVGVVFYIAMVFVHHPWQLLPLQVLNAGFVAITQGLGLTLFQQIIPRPGLASGLYANTRRVGNIVSGPMIALAAVSSLGYGVIFVVSAGLTIVATAMVVLVTRRSMPVVTGGVS